MNRLEVYDYEQEIYTDQPEWRRLGFVSETLVDYLGSLAAEDDIFRPDEEKARIKKIGLGAVNLVFGRKPWWQNPGTERPILNELIDARRLLGNIFRNNLRASSDDPLWAEAGSLEYADFVIPDRTDAGTITQELAEITGAAEALK